MIQFRFDLEGIKRMMSEFNMNWDYHAGRTWDDCWNINVTRVIDELTLWCKANGIANFATGFTQIELCITFAVKSEAMLFKLRWHHAQTA